MRLAILIIFTIIFSGEAMAQNTPFHVTPYPLPRFVTLGSDEVNARSGPGEKYPVQWVYNKKGLPVEVVLEFDAWRKIRDSDGESGWVHSSLLSGRRSGIIQGPDFAPMREKPDEGAKLRVKLEKGTIVSLDECEADWCYVKVQGYAGWVQARYVWGVYEGESFD